MPFLQATSNWTLSFPCNFLNNMVIYKYYIIISYLVPERKLGFLVQIKAIKILTAGILTVFRGLQFYIQRTDRYTFYAELQGGEG